MAIYRNVVVDIPVGAYIEKSDQSVFVKDLNVYDPVNQYNRVKHTIIGRAIDATRMYPNHNFRIRYPAEYQKASGETGQPEILRVGFYAVVLSVIERTGLYQCLSDTMGIEQANLILDFCMFSILNHSSVADGFQPAMKDHMIFSRVLKSGKDLSLFFNQDENEQRIEKFKSKWGEACKLRGIEDVWLAIDGSNNDCAAENSELAERGHAKSGKDVSIVSYMYAVDCKDGSPITFDVYRGGCVDSKAVLKMIGWLNAYQIKVKGVVVDRGFATKDVLEQLDSQGIKYVAMLKGDTNAHKEMLEKYASVISRRYDYVLDKFNDGKKLTDRQALPGKLFLKNDNVMYGITSEKKVKLFGSHNYEAYVSLVFDGSNGEERQQNWFKKVSNAALNLQSQIDAGKSSASVPSGFENYLEIRDFDGEKVVVVKREQVQIKGDGKGFSSLATSDRMEASEANRIYTLRNSVEEDFAIAKTQLGYSKTGTHTDSGIKTKLAIGFIASIIRSELLKAARASHLATNKIIKELNFITLHADSSDRYFACHTENERQKLFLKECGVVPSDLDRIAEAENIRRSSPEPNPFHKFPHSEETVKRGRGRPKGTTKKSSEAGNDNAGNNEKRTRGRPKGSKNKKTATGDTAQQNVEQKKRGRPKGSKNKPKSQ